MKYYKDPKISIIMPVFNGIEYISESISSILNQSYVNFELIIIDGASIDGTLEVLQSIKDERVMVISEPDNGMYDALVKGFKLCEGDIITYLNADDLLMSGAFRIAVDCLSYKHFNWITGRKQVVIGHNSGIPKKRSSYIFRSLLIRQGYYGMNLPFIQQEGTFWDAGLLKCIDYNKLKGLKLAGDYYIWYCFSKENNLKVIKNYTAAFRINKGQLSEQKDKYFNEIKSFIDKKSFLSICLYVVDFPVWCVLYITRALTSKLQKDTYEY